MFAALSERDVERAGRRLRIIEKHLEKIAHAHEEQSVRVFGFQREPLRHGGRSAIGPDSHQAPPFVP